MMRGTSYNARNAVCPFYMNDDDTHIWCEGVYPDTSIKHTFRRKKDKDVAFCAYCCEYAWKKCPLAQAVNKEYE